MSKRNLINAEINGDNSEGNLYMNRIFQITFVLCVLPFFLNGKQENTVWNEYSKKLTDQIPSYGRNSARNVQARFIPAGNPMPEKVHFRIPEGNKIPKALFITGRNYYRLLKGTGERAGMMFDLAPHHYFSDSGYPQLPHLQKKKRISAARDAELLNLLNRNGYGLLVTGTLSYRNPLPLNKSLPEIEKMIRGGFFWLEIGNIKTSPILKLFPNSERKKPVIETPDGSKLYIKTIGKGRIGVLVLNQQHNEGDYFRIFEAISIVTGSNPGISLTLADNQFLLQGNFPEENSGYLLELYDPVTQKRFRFKGSAALNSRLDVKPPPEVPATDYLATLSLFDKNGGYIAGCAGKYSLVNRGKIAAVETFSNRESGVFQAKVTLRNHSGGTVKLRLMDGLKRYIPVQQTKEISAGTTVIDFSLKPDYAYLNTNAGYAEVTFLPKDETAATVFYKLFTVPFTTAEQHNDYQQILWGLPGDLNDLDLFVEHTRALGFNAICTGYFFKESTYRQFMERLSRYGMPIHLEYLLADGSVFGNFGARNKGNKHFVDLGNRYERRRVRRIALQRAEALSKYGVAGYACSEEIGLGVEETCFHPAVQYQFGKWCLKKYKTLEALNHAWGTNYRSAEDIKGILLADNLKKTPDKPGQWIDFRMFMEELYNSLMKDEFFGSFQKKAPGCAAGYNAGPYVDVPTQGLNAASLGKTINYSIEYLPGFLGYHLTLSGFDMLSARKIPYLYSVSGYPNAYQETDANYDFRIWYTLLHGGRGNAWFSTLDDGGFSKFTADGSPSGTAKMISDNSADARNGLGKFIMEAEPDIKAGIYYSRRSRYMRYYLQQQLAENPEEVKKAEAALADAVRNNPGVLESSTGDSTGFAMTDKAIPYMKSLIEDAGERWDLVFEDMLLSGEAEKKYKVLCLPAVMVLSENEIAALERFVKNGGVLIADTMTGWFDENGNPNPHRPKLDTLFGIKRKSMELPLFPKQNVKLKNGLSVPVYRGEPVVSANGSGNGLLHINRTGKGKTLYLNGYFSNKKLHLLPEIPLEVRWIVKSMFPAPKLKTFSGTRETPGISGVEISRFTHGNAVLYTFHRRFIKNQDQISELRFDKKYHLYDTRLGKYLGFTDRIPFTIPDEGRMKAISVLTYRTGNMKVIQLNPDEPGQIFRGMLQNASKDHIFSIRIYRPDGKEECRFKKNVRSQFVIPFLPSDPKGKWKCIAKDILTGASTEIIITN